MWVRGGSANAHDHWHAAIRLIQFGCDATVIGRTDGFQHICRLQAVEGKLIRKQRDLNLRLPRRNHEAHVAATGQVLQNVDDLRTDAVVGVEIRADDADGKGG